MSTNKIDKIREFWRKYEGKIVLFLGILLISLISFQLGTLKGEKWQQDPLIIEKVPEQNIYEPGKVLGESSENINISKEIVENKASNKADSCLFVGSKNSDKYHKDDCRWAEQIKPDNRVCFKSIKEAEDMGYVAASCMK